MLLSIPGVLIVEVDDAEDPDPRRRPGLCPPRAELVCNEEEDHQLRRAHQDSMRGGSYVPE